MEIQVTKGLTQIIFNNLPTRHLGQWIENNYNMELAVVPPDADGFYYVGVKPFMLVIESNSNRELYKFQTETNYKISRISSSQNFFNAAHQCILDAVSDFNNLLLQTGSTLGYGREFIAPSFEETINRINVAMGLNRSN